LVTLPIQGFIVTGVPTEAYGGVALAEQALQQIVEQLRRDGLPLGGHHDPRIRLHPKLLNVEIRQTEAGDPGVWVEFEIDEDEWEPFRGLPGLSISVITEFRPREAGSAKPAISIAADAGHFDDETFGRALEALAPYFNVGGGRFYQFSEIPPPNVLVEIALVTIQAMGPNLAASSAWDALKYALGHLRRPKHADRSIFTFEIRDITRTIRGHLETNDDRTIAAALDTFNDLAKSSADHWEFNETARHWEQLEGATRTAPPTASPPDIRRPEV